MGRHSDRSSWGCLPLQVGDSPFDTQQMVTASHLPTTGPFPSPGLAAVLPEGAGFSSGKVLVVEVTEAP